MRALLMCEVRRLLRSPRFLIFTGGLPLVYFLLFSGIYAPDGGETVVVLMAMMAAFGAISASISVGGRVANERHIGWNRQLRLTPLPPQGYVVGKVVVGMLLALPSLLLVCATGFLTGDVHLAALQWVEVIGLGWVALLPMSAVGVGLGYLARGDTAQAVNGGAVMLMSMFGGVWFPVDGSSPQWLQATAHVMPTYWITQISRAPLTHDWPVVSGWLVLAAWTFVGVRIAARRYLADDLRAA
jgi:ABC-2 type transport system permease protein